MDQLATSCQQQVAQVQDSRNEGGETSTPGTSSGNKKSRWSAREEQPFSARRGGAAVEACSIDPSESRYEEKRRGPRTELCGTPHKRGVENETWSEADAKSCPAKLDLNHSSAVPTQCSKRESKMHDPWYQTQD